MYAEQYFYALGFIWFLISLCSSFVLYKKLKPLKGYLVTTLISLILFLICVILFSAYVSSDGIAKGVATLLYLTYFGVLTIVSGIIFWLGSKRSKSRAV